MRIPKIKTDKTEKFCSENCDHIKGGYCRLFSFYLLKYYPGYCDPKPIRCKPCIDALKGVYVEKSQ